MTRRPQTSKRASSPSSLLTRVYVLHQSEMYSSTCLTRQQADVDLENINKSEASQKIDQLKNQENTPGGGSQGSTSETIQDPESWSTGGESATGRQAGYIKAMASRAGEQVNVDGLSKTDASEKIEELKEKTGM